MLIEKHKNTKHDELAEAFANNAPQVEAEETEKLVIEHLKRRLQSERGLAS